MIKVIETLLLAADLFLIVFCLIGLIIFHGFSAAVFGFLIGLGVFQIMESRQ